MSCYAPQSLKYEKLASVISFHLLGHLIMHLLHPFIDAQSLGGGVGGAGKDSSPTCQKVFNI